MLKCKSISIQILQLKCSLCRIVQIRIIHIASMDSNYWCINVYHFNVTAGKGGACLIYFIYCWVACERPPFWSVKSYLNITQHSLFIMTFIKSITLFLLSRQQSKQNHVSLWQRNAAHPLNWIAKTITSSKSSWLGLQLTILK